MNDSYHIRAHGVPASKGSKRWLPNGRMLDSDPKLRSWESSVKIAYLTAYGKPFPIEGPIKVEIEFYFPRPKNHYGTRSGIRYLKPLAPVWFARTPDIDKCVRATLDPLTGLLWNDDAQVTILNVEQRYEGLETPGAIIRVSSITVVTLDE